MAKPFKFRSLPVLPQLDKMQLLDEKKNKVVKLIVELK